MKLRITRFLIIFFILLKTTGGLAQETDRIRISLLTCSPGTELYSTFGHSAMRVIDSNNVTDLVYNYGTFDFSDPDFYPKFIRGKLLYYLSLERFEDFVYSYQADNRSITEQVLDLTPAEEQAIKNALYENLKPENRAYKYDFCLDNCTTRLRDKIEDDKNPRPQFPFIMPDDYTFRDGIHFYLDKNKKYWSKLGIDLLLGSRMDVVMSARQQLFLPDNLMYGLTKSSVKTVASEQVILPNKPEDNSRFQVTPMMVSIILLVLGLLSLLIKSKAVQKFYRFYSFSVYLFAGLLGVLLVFMWFGTDHIMTKANYNLLWAIPFHTYFAFQLNKPGKLARKYFLVSAIIALATLILSPVLPQQLNYALFPLIALLGIISYNSFRSSGKV